MEDTWYDSAEQSYVIKSPPWTIWWFRILWIFSVENIDRLGDFMLQTSENSQLCIDSQYSSQQLTFAWSLKHQISQPIYIFNRVKVFHLDRLKKGTWLHCFGHSGCPFFYVCPSQPRTSNYWSCVHCDPLLCFDWKKWVFF